jgi:hypothetical protein
MRDCVKARIVAALAELFCVFDKDGLNLGIKSNAIFLFPVTLKLFCLFQRLASVTFQYVNCIKGISVMNAYNVMSALRLIDILYGLQNCCRHNS